MKYTHDVKILWFLGGLSKAKVLKVRIFDLYLFLMVITYEYQIKKSKLFALSLDQNYYSSLREKGLFVKYFLYVISSKY